ncbi:MAG: acyl-protein synthetase [Candidatus Omnitrophica bacterium]|nr:acyl-protein synthetase [Candidatus Omnitrophota bacterium]
MTIEQLFTSNPYCLNSREKQKLLTDLLWKLTLKHKTRCRPYRRLLKALPISLSPKTNLNDLPMLPVRIFKSREFSSTTRPSVIRVITSSGTTAQIPSRIVIDKKTIALEIKAFSSVVRSAVGKKRFPLILIDSASSTRDSKTLNVRNYTLRGWKNFSSDCLFLLDEAMNIKWAKLKTFLNKHQGEKIVLFGLTFMVWQKLYQPLLKHRRKLKIAEGILFHTGGWKKLAGLAKGNKRFKLNLSKQLGLRRIHNFYGMAELIGIIFLECAKGHLHAPDFADIIIRDPNSLKPLPKGHQGLIQVFSPLAQSFPGHSLLTEDLGRLLGEDDCPCGRRGKYFQVYGRMPWAEIRGCSNTYAYQCYSREDD